MEMRDLPTKQMQEQDPASVLCPKCAQGNWRLEYCASEHPDGPAYDMHKEKVGPGPEHLHMICQVCGWVEYARTVQATRLISLPPQNGMKLVIPN